MTETTTPRKLIRTFVRRERMSENRQERLNNLLKKYGINFNIDNDPIDPKAIFGRTAPLYLEIGCGNGEVLFNLAKQYPEYDFIGIEVYQPGVENLLRNTDENHLTNVRAFTQDARLVLASAIPNNILEGILIFFPDPWQKKRHHKRRLVQTEFTELLITKLRYGGYIHFASDIEDYVQHAEQVLSANKSLQPTTIKDPKILPRSSSKFALRGTKAGRESRDIVFRKRK